MSKPRYHNLELQPIAGQWRVGSAGRDLYVMDPFTGESLLKLSMASHEDLDQAYHVAQTAQVEWAATGPTARGDIMRRAVDIFDERKQEILDWLIRESGSTRIKAEIEWASARAITLESAGLPGRAHGRILPSDVPAKKAASIARR
jgi:aldehyde dehydrogenase (NAD+)